MLKQFVKKLAHRIYQLALQHETEEIRLKFNLPASMSFGQLSIEGNVTIGEYTYINDGGRIDSGSLSKIVIGKHCAIGRFVHVTSKTHDLTHPTTDDQFKTIKIAEGDVIIGNHVWIGDKVTILPNVQIGDYAIIAAHAVVTKNVKPFEIVGGVPAKHIRYNADHYRYLDISK